MTEQYKAIETEYKGYRFRSRSEARWAIFFDTLNIPYIYEPEGYEIDQVRYLPDFWLPNQDCFFEVKGISPSKDETEKARKLAAATHKFVFIFGGAIGPSLGLDGKSEAYIPHLYIAPDGDSDGCMDFGECYTCQKIVIGHFGSHSRSYSKFDDPYLCTKELTVPFQYDPTRTERLLDAYKKARGARFEHGENA